ncbi:hypothetical protein ADK86_19545, partial [Streptomyces sp. NRRL F-5755]
MRFAAWSAGCGITARIPRRRRWPRIAREEYAETGAVRGLPTGRDTRIRAMTFSNAGASPAWPG